MASRHKSTHRQINYAISLDLCCSPPRSAHAAQALALRVGVAGSYVEGSPREIILIAISYIPLQGCTLLY